MSRAWLVAACALSSLFALPAVSQAAVPPACPDATLDTPPGTALDLPYPTCTNMTGTGTITLKVPPQHGAIQANQPPTPNRYLPNTGFHGVDTLKYTVTDPANGESNVA